mmetsp:Transcript_22464/g.48904  ORF Transcript_22464/g.48904 Transcript_22464/m.48904 type:complete len:230 (+) Transcript_22464:1022-1711(+)
MTNSPREYLELPCQPAQVLSEEPRSTAMMGLPSNYGKPLSTNGEEARNLMPKNRQKFPVLKTTTLPPLMTATLVLMESPSESPGGLPPTRTTNLPPACREPQFQRDLARSEGPHLTATMAWQNSCDWRSDEAERSRMRTKTTAMTRKRRKVGPTAFGVNPNVAVDVDPKLRRLPRLNLQPTTTMQQYPTRERFGNRQRRRKRKLSKKRPSRMTRMIPTANTIHLTMSAK